MRDLQREYESDHQLQNHKLNANPSMIERQHYVQEEADEVPDVSRQQQQQRRRQQTIRQKTQAQPYEGREQEQYVSPNQASGHPPDSEVPESVCVYVYVYVCVSVYLSLYLFLCVVCVCMHVYAMHALISIFSLSQEQYPSKSKTQNNRRYMHSTESQRQRLLEKQMYVCMYVWK